MIDFNQAISIIRRNGGFKPNKKDTSYYRTYNVQGSRPMQVRVSNHGTWLWTWYDKDYDPSYAINYCIVFSEDGNYDSDASVDMDIKDEQGNVIGQRESFEVIQYVYNCQLLDVNDATIINRSVQSIWQNIGFEDPFAGTPKHAKVMKLKPNEEIETIVENKNITCNRNMNKKLIRLTEADLHKVVRESVKKILRENRQMIRELDDKVGVEETFETDEERVTAKIGQILLPIGSIRKGFKTCTVQQVIDVMERGGWEYLNTDKDEHGDYEIYFTDGDDKAVIYYNNFYLKIQNIHSV